MGGQLNRRDKSAGMGTHVVMKNCEPLVLGPALAIDSIIGFSCFNEKSSSVNVIRAVPLRRHFGPTQYIPSN